MKVFLKEVISWLAETDHKRNNYRNRSFLALLIAECIISRSVTQLNLVFRLLFFAACGVSAVDIGFLMAVNMIARLISVIACTKLSDIIGRKPLFIYGFVGYSLSQIIIFLFRQTSGFYVAMAIEGFTWTLAPLEAAYVGDEFSPEKRGATYGIIQSAAGVGRVIGPVIGGYIISLFGFNGYFLFIITLMLIGTSIIILFFKESKSDAVPITQFFRDLRSLSSRNINITFKLPKRPTKENKGLVAYYIAKAFDVGRQIVQAFFFIFLANLGIGVADIGILSSISNVAPIVTSPLAGKLSDRIGRKPLILLGLLTSAVTYIIYTQVNAYTELLIIRVIETGMATIILTVSTAFLIDLLPKSNRGVGIGIYNFLADADSALGSSIGGIIIQYYGWDALFYTAAGAALSGTAIFLTAIPEKRKNSR